MTNPFENYRFAAAHEAETEALRIRAEKAEAKLKRIYEFCEENRHSNEMLLTTRPLNFGLYTIRKMIDNE